MLEPRIPNRSWYLRGKTGVCMLSLLRVLTVVSFLSNMSLRHVILTLALAKQAISNLGCVEFGFFAPTES